MLSRRVMAALLTAPLLLATACGNVERKQPEDEFAKKVDVGSIAATVGSAPPPPSSSAAPSKAASSAPAGSGAASPAAPAGGGTEVKATAANQFAPATLEVKVGTEVTFANEGGYHTVVGGDGTPDPASPIGGNIVLAAAGDMAKVKFDKPGSYAYFCVPHLSVNMKGTIVVS